MIDYHTENGDLVEKDEHDIGFDIPNKHKWNNTIEPGEMVIVESGASFKFPKYGRIRRFMQRLLLGFEITGIGGLIFPRSKSNLIIGAGVIDVGYRGDVGIKVTNTTKEPIVINNGERFAQIVPIPCINLGTRWREQIEQDTKRGSKGGIWNTHSG